MIARRKNRNCQLLGRFQESWLSWGKKRRERTSNGCSELGQVRGQQCCLLASISISVDVVDVPIRAVSSFMRLLVSDLYYLSEIHFH